MSGAQITRRPAGKASHLRAATIGSLRDEPALSDAQVAAKVIAAMPEGAFWPALEEALGSYVARQRADLASGQGDL